MSGGRPLVLVVTRTPEWHAAELAQRIPELEFVGAPSFAELAPRFEEAEILICGDALTAEIVERMPRLRWVQAYISATDGIRAALGGRPDVAVTSARGLHGPQMAEMALLHMLYLSRSVRALTANQAARVWEKLPQRVLERRTVGIVGIGTIGETLARLCKALDMTVHGFSRTTRPVAGIDRIFPRDELAARAGELDFLVLVVPYSDETDGLVGKEVLRAMRPTAVLVNLSRGAVVDETALVAALRAGEIAGAGLDVFAHEPLPPESPLWTMPNVFVTPHLGGQSDRYHEQLLPLLEDNLRRQLRGEPLLNVIHLPEAAE
jgi:phosphoglycerate dehydrogenase-like enzyme